MSTADFSHIGQEFQPTEGQQASASHGTEAKAGEGPAQTLFKQMMSDATLPPLSTLGPSDKSNDGYFCRAMSIFLAVRDKMSDTERASVLHMLEVESRRRELHHFKEAGPGLIGFNPQ